MKVWQALDPRAKLGARIGWCVALPLSALWIWSQTGQASARIGWGLAAICATAIAAGTLASRSWARVRALLAARDASDLSPLPAAGPHESRALIGAVNTVLAHQHAATERQRRMVADAAHQLRTPLAALRAQLQSTAGDSVAQRLPDMLRTVDRATNVANEFLTQMKLEQRSAALLGADAWPALQIDDVAREAALEFSPLIADKRLAFELDALPIAVNADAWMVGELVRNLLANAIGHTPAGGPLGIVVRRAIGAAEMVVWDSGPGISDEVRERVFEPFAAAARGAGVGLGLSICRQLAQAMGAQVELFNRSDGMQIVGVDAVVRWHAASSQSVVVEGDKP